MTENEKLLLDMIKTVTDGAIKGDDKILEAIETIANRTKDVVLKLNDKIVDLDERVHRLENQRK